MNRTAFITEAARLRAEARLLACRIAAMNAALARWMARQTRRAAFLLLLLCFVAGLGKATAAVNVGTFMGPQPCASLAVTSLSVPLAQFPPVDGASLGNWLIIALAVVAGLDRVLAMIDRARHKPPLHKQYTDREDHDRDIKEIKESLTEMKSEFGEWSTSHYDARRRMHRKINHLSSAMAYLAGSIEHKDARTANRLRELLKEADQEADEDE